MQVKRNFIWIFLEALFNLCCFCFFKQLSEVRNELEALRRHYENVQTEKKELEEEFSQLKDNYSLLSSQSKTVSPVSLSRFFQIFFHCFMHNFNL
jgi:DNA repair exonuclease SbcCD ATPase subunit